MYFRVSSNSLYLIILQTMQSSNLPLPCHLANPEKSLPEHSISSLLDLEQHIERPMPSPDSSPQPSPPPEIDNEQAAEHKGLPSHIPDPSTRLATPKVTFTEAATHTQSSQPSSSPQPSPTAALPNPRTLPVLLGRSNHARWHAALSPILASRSLPPNDLTNLHLCRFIRATLAMNVLPHVQLHQQAGRLWDKLNELYGVENGIAAVGGPRVRRDGGRGLGGKVSLGSKKEKAAGHELRTGREVVERAGLVDVAEEVNWTEKGKAKR